MEVVTLLLKKNPEAATKADKARRFAHAAAP